MLSLIARSPPSSTMWGSRLVGSDPSAIVISAPSTGVPPAVPPLVEPVLPAESLRSGAVATLVVTTARCGDHAERRRSAPSTSIVSASAPPVL
ncbi:MAG: hypothetical protein WKF58_09135 [Ilumatobacteraceae bacterium]